MNKRENSQWRIPKYRYQELRNFCLQYPDWVRESDEILDRVPAGEDPTGDDAVRLAQLRQKRSDVTDALYRTSFEGPCQPRLVDLLYLVTNPGNLGYSGMSSQEVDLYHELYKRFFWHLDRIHN